MINRIPHAADQPHVPTLTGPRIVLRAPQSGDAARRLALGHSSEVLQAYGMDSATVPSLTETACQGWLAEQQAALAWMITLGGDQIGTVRLHSHVMADRRANLAIGLLDAAHLGQGYGTEALRLVIEQAFDGMGLNRLSLRVLDTNERAIRCYAKLGFVTEGRERQSARTADGWRDDVMMGLLASEWVPD